MEPLPYEDGTYRTAPVRVSFMAKALPSVVHYWRLYNIVAKSSRMARHGEYGTEEWGISSIFILRSLEAVGVRFEITGIENLTSFEGPCVFIPNHMSTLETFCLPGIITPFKTMTFVVKQSLLEYPVFKHVMRSRDPIAVGRENPREDLKAVLEGGTRKLKEGTSMTIFPQTTRAADFNPSEFNTLGIKLARRADVPAVPVALKTDAWGVGPFFMKDFGRIDPSRTVHISFGEPLRVKGRGDEEHGRVVEFIGSKLREWAV